MTKKIFLPIIDNGMGLSRTSWAFSLAVACLGVLSKHEVTLQSISYPYPDGAMNLATASFLESGCDEMLVIDTDVVFSDKLIERLLSHDEPLVFGLYPKKVVGLNFPMEPLDGDEFPFSTSDGRPVLREFKRVARGFMRVNRSVFEALKPHVPFEHSDIYGKESYTFWKVMPGGHSEDYAFCDLYRSIGGKVMVDISCCAQHEGSVVYPIPGTYTS